MRHDYYCSSLVTLQAHLRQPNHDVLHTGIVQEALLTSKQMLPHCACVKHDNILHMSSCQHICDVCVRAQAVPLPKSAKVACTAA